jgi:transcription elongation factor Elf1
MMEDATRDSTPEDCLRHKQPQRQVCGACYHALRLRLQGLTMEVKALSDWVDALVVQYGENNNGNQS